MRAFTLAALVSLTITLSSRGAITGTVVDSATGKPIRDYSLVLRPIERSRSNSIWQQHTLKHVRDGSPFTIDTRRMWETTEIRVWCDGYRPATAQVKRGQDAQLTLKLERDPGVSGRILTPDGKPGAGATVALATVTTEPSVVGAQLHLGSSASCVGAAPALTGDEGTFTLPSEIDPARLIAVHASGWAEAELRELNKPVVLKPWARIEGVLMLGDKLAGADWAVSVSRSSQPGRDDEAPVARFWYEINTDDRGRFVVDTIVAAHVHVCPLASIGPGRTCTVHGAGTMMDLRPGETSRITLGGVGRPIVGGVVGADGKGIGGTRGTFRILLRAPHIGFPGDDAIWKAQARFLEAAGSGRYHREVIPDADGRFRIDALPQGDYQIVGLPVISRNGGFVVEPMEGGRSDQPLDLGEMKVRPPATAVP